MSHNSIDVSGDNAGYTFSVSQVLQLGNNENLKLNVLYRLMMYHPAINAVGIFSQGSGTVLVFFQVSKSPYEEHSLKIVDVMDNRFSKKGYTELTANHNSIHDYYKDKATIKDVFYVYISMTTIDGVGSKVYESLKTDANEKGIMYAVLSKDSLLYKELQLE